MFCDLFKITDLFALALSPFRNWNQIFFKRYRFLQNLCFIDFHIVSIETSITLKTHLTKLRSLSKDWCNFYMDQLDSCYVFNLRAVFLWAKFVFCDELPK